MLEVDDLNRFDEISSAGKRRRCVEKTADASQ
jgi:hypothetical protein